MHLHSSLYIKRTSLWLSFFVFTINAYGSPPSAAYQQAYKFLWELRLDDANNVVLNHQEKHHIKGLATFLKGYMNDDESIALVCVDDMSLHITELEKLKSQFSLTATAELYILRSSLRVKHGARVTAAWDFWKGYRLAKSNYTEHPNHPIAKLHWGIIECGLGSMPPHLQRYLSWIGFSGDLDAGTSLLKSCYKTSKQAEWEHLTPLTGLAYVSTQVQLNNKQTIRLKTIGVKAEKSPITTAVEAKLLFDRSKASEAYALLEQYTPHKKAIAFPYLTYIKGRIAVTLQKPDADEVLNRFINETKGDFFVASTHRYLWWHYHLKGNTSLATIHRKAITDNRNNTLTGADELAVYEAQFPLNDHLLIARLLFDQGKFSRSMQHITSRKSDDVCNNNRERGAYFYRLGRCHQNLNQPNEALKRLDQSIGFYGNLQTFERANALIHAGSICEDLNRNADAIDYYKQVLTFSDYPFNEGLHQKAKSGIKRCK